MAENGLPLVSVIIPCYNVEKYVDRAVKSILSQTFKNLEIWIIDDASTDATLEKINSFFDERIKVVPFAENTQKVGAVNEVLKKINGDYIAFQDADDWSEPERLEQQVNQFLKDPQLGICFTNYQYVSSKTFVPGKISLTNEELRNEFLNFNSERKEATSPTNCPTMMISREALDKTGGYHPYFAGRVAEDIQWIYRILKDFKGITVDEVLYNYQSRDGSFTHIQATGIKPKYLYSWQLLSKIIYQDIHNNVDMLASENIARLKELELEACEDALVHTTQLLNETRLLYENSTSFKLGKLLLKPFHALKNLTRRPVKKYKVFVLLL